MADLQPGLPNGPTLFHALRDRLWPLDAAWASELLKALDRGVHIRESGARVDRAQADRRAAADDRRAGRRILVRDGRVNELVVEAIELFGVRAGDHPAEADNAELGG